MGWVSGPDDVPIVPQQVIGIQQFLIERIEVVDE